ncbi:hypothetical protein ACQ1Q5_00125 [Ornithobacterium rhinotracheale]
MSELYKGQIPTNILNSVNSLVISTYSKERKEYYKGTKSLRNYKKGMPIPFGSSQIKNLKENDGNYEFDLFGIKFKTYFGRDLSGNKSFFDKALIGKYKLCDSSIQIENKKILYVVKLKFTEANIVNN